jgi:hypothetical protein
VRDLILKMSISVDGFVSDLDGADLSAGVKPRSSTSLKLRKASIMLPYE